MAGAAGGGPSRGKGGGGSAIEADFTGVADPEFDFANQFLGQGPTIPGGPNYGPTSGTPGGPRGRAGGPPFAGNPGAAGRPAGGAGFGPPGIPPAGARGGAATGSTGVSGSSEFTRWVYKRGGSKYGFVLDKYNRVIQIEAIGLSDPRVSTRRGIHFGKSFKDVILSYAKNPDGTSNQPDGYEVNGNSVIVRYLVKNKVAFKLSRLGQDKPFQVTGIVIAAGKF
jgi:hypothetical protein